MCLSSLLLLRVTYTLHRKAAVVVHDILSNSIHVKMVKEGSKLVLMAV